MCIHDSSNPQSNARVWHPDDKVKATPSKPNSSSIYRPDVLETIEAKVADMDAELRALSLDIHGIFFALSTNALICFKVWTTISSSGTGL